MMMRLAEEIGRQHAHDVIYEDAMEALATDASFRDCLLADERVTSHLSSDEIDAHTGPEAYTGLSVTFVDEVLDRVDGASR